MADDRTRSTLRRRKRWKIGGFTLAGILLGLALKLAFEFEPADAFFNSVQPLTGWFPPIRQWLDVHPEIRGWIVGPVAFGMLFLAAGSVPWFRRSALDRFFPDPPSFTRSDLDEARRRERMISLEGPPLPFVGREAELAGLGGLLGEPDKFFAWRALTGPSGIGKSRLAIEWLEKAKAKGWDIGIVDPVDFTLVGGWEARRPTALVVDEAGQDWEGRLGHMLTALAKSGTARRPVRALVVDQLQPFVDIRSGEDRALVRAAEAGPPLRLRELEDADIVALCAAAPRQPADVELVVRESSGLPRAALILINAGGATSYAGAIDEWADRFLPDLANPAWPLPLALAGPLFLAALAGPVDTDLARELCGDVDAAALARFYPESAAAGLERQLPALTPDDLAAALLLRLLPRFDLRRREAMVDRLLIDMPAAVEARLGTIWRARPDLDTAEAREGAAADLRWLQQRFDDAHPDYVANARAQARAAAAQVIADEEAIPVDGSSGLDDLAALSGSRPFDPDVRAFDARGASLAVRAYGESGDLIELERWSARLAAAADRFPDHDEIAEIESITAMVAITCCAPLDAAEIVEGWAARLSALSSREPFRSNLFIRRCQATAYAEAIGGFGPNRQFGQVERWGERLIAVVEDGDLAADLEIRRIEATGVNNACAAYGEARRFQERDRWAARLFALLADPRFADDWEIRNNESLILSNAMVHHGRYGEWEALEQWGSRLLQLLEDQRFVGNPGIAEAAAHGMVGAVSSYGSELLFTPLERWGHRLGALAHEERHAANCAVWEAEATAAESAMGAYGSRCAFDHLERWGARLVAAAGKPALADSRRMGVLDARGASVAVTSYAVADELEPIERWGARVVALAEDPRFADEPEVRRCEAVTAYNAIVGYRGRARYRGAAERWRQRLARVALDFPSDESVQQAAGLLGLGAGSQALDGYAYGRPSAG